jgi:hypothetical protein
MKHKERDNMSLLQDKHFEDLDFISQAVEPFYHPALDLFKSLPEEILISTDQLKEVLSERYNNMRTLDDYKIERKIRDAIAALNGTSEFSEICYKFYDPKINDLSYDVYEDSLLGTITLVKKKDCPLSQEEIAKHIKILINECLLDYSRIGASKKEQLDLAYLFLGAEVTNQIIENKLKPKQTWWSICDKIQDVMLTKYRIRGYNAALKLNKNIDDFLKNKNSEKAMANLTLFKMVMDKGNAVYSLQEIGE